MNLPVNVERRRHRRGFSFWARIVLMTQLCVGTLVVHLLAQMPNDEWRALERERQAVSDRMASVENRLTRLDDLRIAERLAVLDRVEAEGHEQKMLTIGTMVALLGNLGLGLIERRRSQR